ncbi:DNA-binding FadR family transcriptional regulator [Allocatelliglobosispora scoriae]|uniref:DNA-binding FadR family transcriptional regulator n=1 Tax=Allocatelliglobosispora scoriae TaxID=643052 RepID=A0A841C286_9ACTN|nr:FCD domain-containing protein [Allocatelliglobosispora scoriae]MBB5874035.1 DNA-binding FadR family transcriptional regulator [Allocatelliglobosispora scoriae]
MPLRSPSRRTLVPQVVEELRTQVCSGEWPVGSRIPTEPELVEALGVGRNTVREAVNALVHAGLLERRQGSGTYVMAIRELDGAVSRRLAEGEIDEAVEVRRAFEVEGARLAAGRRTPGDLELLDAALAAREAAWRKGRVAAFIEADVAFHVAVVAAAHNGMLSDLYASFGTALRASLAETIGGELTQDRYVDHSALVEAIRSGDSTRAAAAAGAFLEHVPMSDRPEV